MSTQQFFTMFRIQINVAKFFFFFACVMLFHSSAFCKDSTSLYGVTLFRHIKQRNINNSSAIFQHMQWNVMRGSLASSNLKYGYYKSSAKQNLSQKNILGGGYRSATTKANNIVLGYFGSVCWNRILNPYAFKDLFLTSVLGGEALFRSFYMMLNVYIPIEPGLVERSSDTDSKQSLLEKGGLGGELRITSFKFSKRFLPTAGIYFITPTGNLDSSNKVLGGSLQIDCKLSDYFTLKGKWNCDARYRQTWTLGLSYQHYHTTFVSYSSFKPTQKFLLKAPLPDYEFPSSVI